jgi:hypothetical protein
MTYSLEQIALGLLEQLPDRAPWAEQGWRWGKIRTDREIVNQTLVIVRPDYDADSYEHPAAGGGSGNPKRVGQLWCAGVIELHAYSTDVGAKAPDHYRRCKDLQHAVLAALRSLDLQYDLEMRFGAMGWKESEQESEYGARYEIHFEVSETVYDVTADVASGVEHGLTGYMVIDGTSYAGCS